MIGQYLSNTNKNATIPILQKNLELKKALVYWIEREKKFSLYYLAPLLGPFLDPPLGREVSKAIFSPYESIKKETSPMSGFEKNVWQRR